MPQPKPTADYKKDYAIEPFQIFDDVYYIGRKLVGVYIIKTSEGLVLIDTMDPADAGELHIIPGMQALGLDPQDIRLIIVTHGHYDHFGGARKLQEKFGCPVAMGTRDAAHMVNNTMAPLDWLCFPRVNTLLEDGQPITVGDHTFTPYLTPGHTPGGMSFIFNCTDGGEQHLVSMWVGAGLPYKRTTVALQIEETCGFVQSAHRFADICEARGCDVMLAVHPHHCDMWTKLEKLQARSAGEPHPFVVGIEPIRANLKTLAKGAIDLLERIIEEDM